MKLRAAFRAGIIVVVLGAALCTAQENPHALVSQMVQHELASQKHQNYWLYIDSDTNGGVTKVNRVVQTPECWFKWLVSVNGNPASSAQQQAERAKINELVDNASARHRSRQEIDQDGQKAEALVKQLPNIFVYTDDGEQDGNIRLTFKPNPK